MVAVTANARERPVGLASLVWVKGGLGQEAKRAYLAWQVIPAYTQTDVVARLIAETIAIDVGKDTEFEQIVTQRLFVEEDTEPALLETLGFKVAESLDIFQAPLAKVLSRSERAFKRLKSRGAIPRDALISPFEPDLIPSIRALFHNIGLVSCLEFDAKLTQAHKEPVDLSRSTAITIGGELVGALMLCAVNQGEEFIVSGRWVAEQHRNGWVNTLLIYNSTNHLLPLGIELVRFVANSGVHRETQRLATRLGAIRLAQHHRMSLPISAARIGST